MSYFYLLFTLPIVKFAALMYSSSSFDHSLGKHVNTTTVNIQNSWIIPKTSLMLPFVSSLFPNPIP